jgi:hypothetical protein
MLAALGLSEAEYAEIVDCSRRQEQYRTIRSRPQDCDAWLEGRTGEPEAPAGRTFERLPRILRCSNERRAVVHFYPSDNPFGNPPEIVAGLRGKSAAFVRLTWHGLAERTVNVKFPTFSRKVHVVKASAIPREGTNWMIVDPCSGRNMFMGWFRSVPGATYMYREWPGNYHIPRIGVPEPWAVFSTDAKRMDGARGGGQKTFGWGMLDYKREIARLERWSAFEQTENGRQENGKPDEDVKEWDQDGAAGERIAARYMDARFANVKSFDEGGMRTLIEAFEDVGLTFLDTSQNATGTWTIDEGCALVNDALAYDASRPLDLNNQPKFFISDECVNTIFAMETWTGHDGTDGATKDPCDVVRYLFMKGCEYEEPVTAEMVRAGRGGGCY